MKLRAAGAVATAVLNEWGQPLATRNLTLHLHGVEMKGLESSPTTGDRYVDLSFRLSRDSTNDENRVAWSSLLTRERIRHDELEGFEARHTIPLGDIGGA